MNHLGSAYAHRKNIQAAQAASRAASMQADIARNRSRDVSERLEDQIARLKLVNEAMWQLITETSGLTDEHLVARIAKLDFEDGQMDGRRRHAAAQCESCNATVSPDAKKCTFCGNPAPQGGPFAF